MRKWIAEKLFDAAMWLDWEEAVKQSYSVVFAEMIMDGELAMTEQAAPKKRGRPAKPDTWRTHAWVPGEKPAPKKRGRPKGSKNKPKEAQP